jgi:hypothetical protein
MNDEDFKHHLKDLAHGHHHPEEHDWQANPEPTKQSKAGVKTEATKRRVVRKTARKK